MRRKEEGKLRDPHSLDQRNNWSPQCRMVIFCWWPWSWGPQKGVTLVISSWAMSMKSILKSKHFEHKDACRVFTGKKVAGNIIPEYLLVSDCQVIGLKWQLFLCFINVRPPWKAGAYRTEEKDEDRDLSWDVWRRRDFNWDVKIRYERSQQEENKGRAEKEENRYP